MDLGQWLAVGRSVHADPRRAGREAAEAARAGDSAALVIVFSSEQSEPAEMLAGGNCGPDPALGHGYQLHGREVLTGSVVAAVIASDRPFGIGVGHGCRKVGEPMIVTSSAHGEVYTLDDQPALHAYLGRLGAP